MSSSMDTPLCKPVLGQIFRGDRPFPGSIERYGRAPFAGVYAKRARRILSASFIGARPRKSMLSALAASGKCFLSRTGSCPRKGLGPMSPILA